MPWCTVRVPATSREPGDAGRREGPSRVAGGSILVLAMRERPGVGQGRADRDGGLAAGRRSRRGDDDRPLRPPGGRRPYGRQRLGGCGGRRLPRLRRAESADHRRQRAADTGQRQPGTDDHGGRGAGRGATDRRCAFRPGIDRRGRRPDLADDPAPRPATEQHLNSPNSPKEVTMAKQTVADHLLQRLREWDVDIVFGYPGDGINGLLAAWVRARTSRDSSRPRTRRWRPSKPSGTPSSPDRIGVCAATSGPGAIHLLNGLYDAKSDHVPVLAIVGQTARSALGGSYQQEVDLDSLFTDVAAVRGDGHGRRATAQRARPRDPHRTHRADPTASSCLQTCRNCRTRRRPTTSRWCRRARVWRSGP